MGNSKSCSEPINQSQPPRTEINKNIVVIGYDEEETKITVAAIYQGRCTDKSQINAKGKTIGLKDFKIDIEGIFYENKLTEDIFLKVTPLTLAVFFVLSQKDQMTVDEKGEDNWTGTDQVNQITNTCKLNPAINLKLNDYTKEIDDLLEKICRSSSQSLDNSRTSNTSSNQRRY